METNWFTLDFSTHPVFFPWTGNNSMLRANLQHTKRTTGFIFCLFHMAEGTVFVFFLFLLEEAVLRSSSPTLNACICCHFAKHMAFSSAGPVFSFKNNLQKLWFFLVYWGGGHTEGRPAFPDIMKKARSHQHLMKNEILTDLYPKVKTTGSHVLLTHSSCFWFLPLWSAGWSFVAPSFCRKDSSVWPGIWLEMDSRYIRTKRSASVSTKRWLKTGDQTREMR